MRARETILLFVKWSEPGRVKTRLAAEVGTERAVEIYRELVARVCGLLPRDVAVRVMFDPAERRAEIEPWLRPLITGATFFAQQNGDLGARLTHAFAGAFANGCAKVAAIGSDCVELDDAIFCETWDALDAHDCVLGPTFDGGYYLIALRQPCAALFENIAWSTSAVFEQTRARAAALGLRVHRLPARHDVDTAEDWRRAAAQMYFAQFRVRRIFRTTRI